MSQVSRNLLVQWRRGMLSRNGSPTREAKGVHRNSSQVLRGPRTNDIDLGWGFQKFPWGNYTDLWSQQPNGHCGFARASYWQLFQTNAIGSTLFKEQLFFLPSVGGTQLQPTLILSEQMQKQRMDGLLLWFTSFRLSVSPWSRYSKLAKHTSPCPVPDLQDALA